ncbi:hypothetical protein HPB48_006169 [Haemaphysalis longicornis]|uniref:Uncharacterized protein n=1 Tax=Haemaphysalis longicornis TaxID=44386 RepID=A0A9J6GX05_HAELO|nr:hypothetical protein HPB48_006169 [Haemaphysalis longicornis]
MAAVNAVANNYFVVEELSKRAEFFNVPNQRQPLAELTSELLNDDDSSDFKDCEQGHKSEVYLKRALWCITYILLKNFCQVLNDKVQDTNNKSRKRKLQTLTNK